MKTLMVSLFLCISSYLQGQFIVSCNSDSVPIRLKPILGSKPKIRISTGTKLLAIAKVNDFIKVVYYSDTGYIDRTFIKGVDESIKENDSKSLDKKIKFLDNLNNLPEEITHEIKPIKYLSDALINDAIQMYGKEDDRSQYQSGDYDSITLVWHCAKGNYRSITYVYKKGEYVKDSEFVSNCI